MEEAVAGTLGGTDRDRALRLLAGLRLMGVAIVLIVAAVKTNLDTLVGVPSIFFERLLGVLRMWGSTFSESKTSCRSSEGRRRLRVGALDGAFPGEARLKTMFVVINQSAIAICHVG
jgi:hypothetical protein